MAHTPSLATSTPPSHTTIRRERRQGSQPSRRAGGVVVPRRHRPVRAKARRVPMASLGRRRTTPEGQDVHRAPRAGVRRRRAAQRRPLPPEMRPAGRVPRPPEPATRARARPTRRRRRQPRPGRKRRTDRAAAWRWLGAPRATMPEPSPPPTIVPHLRHGPSEGAATCRSSPNLPPRACAGPRGRWARGRPTRAQAP